MNVDEYLLQQKEKVQKTESEFEKFESAVMKLRKIYPNLEVSVDRWKKAKFIVPDLNPDCVTSYNSCGCCRDADVLVRGYTTNTDTGYSVYTEAICLGNQYYWDSDWKDRIPSGWSKRKKFIKELRQEEPKHEEDDE